MEYNTVITSHAMDSLAKTLFTTIFVECTQIVFDLRWMILLGFMLIVSDLWFGIRASKYLNVNVRKSRAGRRTLNKIIDYICYITNYNIRQNFS